ncbi:MAG TPA: DUF481 domain-containing protein [Gemmatimonadaceae bacterium]|nr:DUF481 domain-containing protein [Gemmatimonadaceae bacterium]
MTSASLAGLVATVCTVLVSADAHGQALGWSGTVEASGNVLFGNTRDRLVAGRLQLGRADSTLEVRSDLRLTYAQGENDAGRRRVKGRTSFASLGLDLHPFRRYSPFWFGSVESSLQQRIARRYSTGAGGKVTFHQRDENELSASLALLGERTRPRRAPDAPPEADPDWEEWRTRWSLRPRVRWRLAETVKLSHVTFYQPAVARMSEFTINSTTSLAVDLTSSIALTVTLHDTYDSEARARGARVNNDGQLLFGLRAGF